MIHLEDSLEENVNYGIIISRTSYSVSNSFMEMQFVGKDGCSGATEDIHIHQSDYVVITGKAPYAIVLK